MKTSHRRWAGIAGALGTLAVLGGCAVAPGPGVYGDPYYEPAYVGTPAYIGVDVYSQPHYRDGYYPGYRPGYYGRPGYNRAPIWGGGRRPPGVRPPVMGGGRPAAPAGVPRPHAVPSPAPGAPGAVVQPSWNNRDRP